MKQTDSEFQALISETKNQMKTMFYQIREAANKEFKNKDSLAWAEFGLIEGMKAAVNELIEEFNTRQDD
jgi:hypothetical protein